LIFSGQGTFWTDLKSFQDAGAMKLLQENAAQTPRGAVPSPAQK